MSHIPTFWVQLFGHKAKPGAPTNPPVNIGMVKACSSTTCSTSISTRSPPVAAPSRRRSPRTFLTKAPVPSGSRPAWTATRASHSSRGAAPRAWRETPSRPPPPRPNRSSTSPRRGAWCLSQRRETALDWDARGGAYRAARKQMKPHPHCQLRSVVQLASRCDPSGPPRSVR